MSVPSVGRNQIMDTPCFQLILLNPEKMLSLEGLCGVPQSAHLCSDLAQHPIRKQVQQKRCLILADAWDFNRDCCGPTQSQEACACCLRSCACKQRIHSPRLHMAYRHHRRVPLWHRNGTSDGERLLLEPAARSQSQRSKIPASQSTVTTAA